MSVPGLPEGASLEEVLAKLVELRRVVAVQAERIAELERRLSADSSNSSRPPSSDAPWEKPARKHSSRGRSGRKPGKQAGAASSSRSLVGDPDRTVVSNSSYSSAPTSRGDTSRNSTT